MRSKKAMALSGLECSCNTRTREATAFFGQTQLTVNTNALLVPPLVQPTFPEFPAGVSTITFTVPAAGITSVDSFIFSSVSLTTVAAKGVVLIRTSEAETKLLPVIVTTAPCCTCAKLNVLGDNDSINGAGRALLHKGFRVLLQPRMETARVSRQAHRAQVRNRMGDTPLGWCSPSGG